MIVAPVRDGPTIYSHFIRWLPHRVTRLDGKQFAQNGPNAFGDLFGIHLLAQAEKGMLLDAVLPQAFCRSSTGQDETHHRSELFIL